MRMFRRIAIAIFLLSVSVGPLRANDLADRLVAQALFKYEALERYNDSNKLAGKSYLNEYVIELDPAWKLNPNWIEEIGEGQKVLRSHRYDVLGKMLRDFNDARKDNLRFYVVVVNDYQAEIKETIDLSEIRGKVENLHELVRFPDPKTDFDRFRTEIADIPKNISLAMQKAGYENRLVYFYGVIRLFKLDKQQKFFKHDNLSLIGEELTQVDEQLRSAARKTVSKNDSPDEEIEGLVASIINAVHTTIDDPDASVPLVDCGDTFEELLSKTQALKEETYESTVSAVAKLLDQPSTENIYGSPYLLVDKPEHFSPDDLFTTAILPDRLSLLANGNSDYKLYVVFKEVDFILSASEWKEFAEAVHEVSSVAKQPNTIVVVVPYYAKICVGKSWLFPVSKHTGLLMPGVYCEDEGLGALMNSAFAGAGQTWEANFDRAFSHIPKRYVTYDYKFLWNGDLIIDGQTDHGKRTGEESIFEVRILEDQRFHELRLAWKEHYLATVGITASNNTMSYTPQQFDLILEADREYSAKVNAILNEDPQFFYVTNTNIVESKLSPAVADEFAKWYCAHKKWGFATYFNSPDDEIFYRGRNPEKIEDGMMLIDIGSGLAAFVGADAIFDGLGAYYAYSNGRYTEAVLYTAAASVPFWSSAVRRAVMEGGTYMLKTFKGTTVSVPRGVVGMNYVFDIKDVFSPFMKTSLEVTAFSRAAKYKSEGAFIEALEDGMLVETSAIKTLNENPQLIDDFHTYYTDTRGDLMTFLDNYPVVGKLSKFNLVSVSWKNNIVGHKSPTDALKFWNSTSKEYSHLVDGELYIKFDAREGYLLFGNHNTGEMLGFYEGIGNPQVVASTGLERILSKLKIYHGVGGPSYVVTNVSSGARIIANPNKTATIIGNYGFGDMKIIVSDELLSNLKTQQFTDKKGGFNVLNVSDESIAANGGHANFWSNFNKPWLQEAVNRGDDIWVASDPMDLSLLRKDMSGKAVNFDRVKAALQDPFLTTEDMSGFAKEIKLLIDNGYTYDVNSKMFIK